MDNVNKVNSKVIDINKNKDIELKLEEKEDIRSLILFGSFISNRWVEKKSDIDIGIIVKDNCTDLLCLERFLQQEMKELFEYEDIHLTFVEESKNNILMYEILLGKEIYVSKYFDIWRKKSETMLYFNCHGITQRNFIINKTQRMLGDYQDDIKGFSNY